MKTKLSPPVYYKCMDVRLGVTRVAGKIPKEDDPMVEKLLLDLSAWSWELGKIHKITDNLYGQRIR